MQWGFVDLTLTTSLERGYLRATARGRFALTTARDLFLAVLEEATRVRTGRLLIDGRGMTGTPRAIERYLYGAFVAAAANRLPRSVVPHPPKFAYVLTYPVLHPGRLGERTARNRGMIIKAFDNVDDAVVWLFGADA